MQKYTFDTCALIAFFRNEAGADKVKTILREAATLKCEIMMHNASVAELYYDSIYTSSKQDAEQVLELVHSYPINFIKSIEVDLIKEIGYFKTTYKVSFADSFVLGLGRLLNSKIVTSDHHEFDIIESKGDALFEWIR